MPEPSAAEGPSEVAAPAGPELGSSLAAADPAQPPSELVAVELARWQAEAEALRKDARALAPLSKAKAYEDLAKLPKLAQKVRGKLAADGRGAALLDEVLGVVQRRAETQRRELARQLGEACAARGLELAVLQREEPVLVRIPPFSVEIDRNKGRATLQFARLPIESAAAEAQAIVALVERWRDLWARDFDAARFFEACRNAWSAARATGLGGASERVEIAELMPFLALQVQPPKFWKDPVAKNFADYSRPRFAFDLMQLRRAGLLTHDGWRLNLGVATGTSASDKKRALFVEDERGQGEYKLTVYFTRA